MECSMKLLNLIIHRCYCTSTDAAVDAGTEAVAYAAAVAGISIVALISTTGGDDAAAVSATAVVDRQHKQKQ